MPPCADAAHRKSDMANVTLRSVSINPGGPAGAVALPDFNLDVANREFVVLVGPPGAGK